MIMAEAAAFGNVDELTETGHDLATYVRQAVVEGTAAHELEKGVWQRVLAMGRQATGQFLGSKVGYVLVQVIFGDISRRCFDGRDFASRFRGFAFFGGQTKQGSSRFMIPFAAKNLRLFIRGSVGRPGQRFAIRCKSSQTIKTVSVGDADRFVFAFGINQIEFEVGEAL